MPPSKELPALKRRVSRAKRFPDNTCPASRHVHAMALALAQGKLHIMFKEEPEHCAGSMLAVLAALFKARTELAKLRTTRAASMADGGFPHTTLDRK